ncbi:MAG: type II toxin-antitoxin system YhaV family toxin [Wenzhouxiangella sp.]|nr:MAG: type II toxin-antitoxin system YhaV family toxin [Wenzhouxiangella sp.]
MKRHGWTLLFHDCLVEQLRNLRRASEQAERKNPSADHPNANTRLFRALTNLILEVIPSDPGRDEYRQGKTLGTDYRHWRRAKIGRRFRLFFRYDSKSRTIVYAWVNDMNTLRAAGSKSDPYAVFQKMLKSGNPPSDWSALVQACRAGWSDE